MYAERNYNNRMSNSFALKKSNAYLTNSDATRIVALRSRHFLGRFLIIKSIIGGSFVRAMLLPPRRHVSESTSCSQKRARSTEKDEMEMEMANKETACEKFWAGKSEILGGSLLPFAFAFAFAFCFLLLLFAFCFYLSRHATTWRYFVSAKFKLQP